MADATGHVMADVTATWPWQAQVDAVVKAINAKSAEMRAAKALCESQEPDGKRLQELLLLKHEVCAAPRPSARPRPSPKRSAHPRAHLPRSAPQYLQLTGDYHVGVGERKQRKRQRELLVDKLTPPLAPSAFPPWSPRDFFRFEIVHASRKPGSRARVGRIITPHGVIDTPCFVPVGTNGALKGVTSEQALEAGVQLMFCNTYHLLVHPGPEVVEAAGGLHGYMSHPPTMPIITDSGGFQVFSLANACEAEEGPELKSRRKRNQDDEGTGTVVSVSEQGVRFRSYLDSHEIFLSPETTVDAQKRFGSDIIIPLDELPPYHVSAQRLRESVFLSHRWMARSLRRHLQDQRQQAMYGVVHGGTDRELRVMSVEYLASLPFDGFAIGGSLGKDRAEMVELLTFLMPLVPAHKPNHLLGIADEASVLAAIPLGVDTFDSCNPTRLGRHGTLMTRAGQIRISQVKHANDLGPIDPQTRTIPQSRSYLHHLYKQHEPIYTTLASLHNIRYMHALTARLREGILNDEI